MTERASLRPVTLVEAIYKGLQVLMEKSGDFLREVAALVLVFIPLDLWQHSMTWEKTIGVLAVCVVLFWAGIGCEFVAIAVKRGRDKYEEEKKRGSDTGS